MFFPPFLNLDDNNGDKLPRWIFSREKSFVRSGTFSSQGDLRVSELHLVKLEKRGECEMKREKKSIRHLQGQKLTQTVASRKREANSKPTNSRENSVRHENTCEKLFFSFFVFCWLIEFYVFIVRINGNFVVTSWILGYLRNRRGPHLFCDVSVHGSRFLDSHQDTCACFPYNISLGYSNYRDRCSRRSNDIRKREDTSIIFSTVFTPFFFKLAFLKFFNVLKRF